MVAHLLSLPILHLVDGSLDGHEHLITQLGLLGEHMEQGLLTMGQSRI